MDFQNRAGSKKGAGGIASESQFNQQRKRQVEELLQQGETVRYTFQDDENENSNEEKKLKANPYIYRNHSGKLVCKLCNTMHMSWSSVERHLGGKKHGINVLRRGELDEIKNDKLPVGKSASIFDSRIEERKKDLKCIDGLIPKHQVVPIIDESSGNEGIAIQVDYNSKDLVEDFEAVYPPFIRIVSGLELSSNEQRNKMLLVIAYEPFENIAIEIPSDREIILNEYHPTDDATSTIDPINLQCTYWNEINRKYFIQIFFENI
ncbi:hypothetical protein RNJ44_04940 [Nakaseomyces bracarensis]|uniref:U1-type domain-containing protein n=1 Tax=Nakaseomyces bracarensis TaxID=273131 RepID=A0ABR4NWC3_9SACH